jgi:hypothetical protein
MGLHRAKSLPNQTWTAFGIVESRFDLAGFGRRAFEKCACRNMLRLTYVTYPLSLSGL